VAHVDLSLSDLYEADPPRGRLEGSLELWSLAAGSAQEHVYWSTRPASWSPRRPAVARSSASRPTTRRAARWSTGCSGLLDFNTISGELPGWEVDKIPPLLAITTGGLARGLLRVPGIGGGISTVDAISVPLRDGLDVVGSLTFFSLVTR